MGLYTVTVSMGRLGGGALGGFAADILGVDGMILLSVILVSAAILIVLLTDKPSMTVQSPL